MRIININLFCHSAKSRFAKGNECIILAGHRLCTKDTFTIQYPGINSNFDIFSHCQNTIISITEKANSIRRKNNYPSNWNLRIKVSCEMAGIKT